MKAFQSQYIKAGITDNTGKIFFDRFAPSKQVLGRKEVEDFRDWLSQWLKENPEKVEGWLSIHASGYTEIIPERDTKLRNGLTDQLAIIPITYHIGDGLETHD